MYQSLLHELWYVVLLLKTIQISSSSRSHIFVKIGVLKNFANFTRKYLCWSSFLKRHCLFKKTILKRDSGTGIFLSKLRNFLEHFLYRTLQLAASGIRKFQLHAKYVVLKFSQNTFSVSKLVFNVAANQRCAVWKRKKLLKNPRTSY